MQYTVWTLLVSFLGFTQPGELPKKASITLVFATQDECEGKDNSEKRDLMLKSIQAPSGTEIGTCIPISITKERTQ